MNNNKIQMVDRFISILDCFSLDKPTLGVREVARETELSSSTTGRIMAYMKDKGVLNQDPETHLYMMGSKVLAWAGIYTVTSDVRSVALPVMVRLQELTRETISLYVLEGNERVCVERLESPETVRIVARVGRRIPLYAGSAGKVFLAFMQEERRESILNSIELKAMTERTITDLNHLRKNLQKIRDQGYAISIGEWLIDAAGTAAPIFNMYGNVVAAISISGPAQRFDKSKMKELAQFLLKETRAISQELGYYPR
jgi:IclR family transcriptional regulator, KDG regulon repressor